jgi:predicted permease
MHEILSEFIEPILNFLVWIGRGFLWILSNIYDPDIWGTANKTRISHAKPLFYIKKAGFLYARKGKSGFTYWGNTSVADTDRKVD